MQSVEMYLAGKKYSIDLEKIIYREIEDELFIFDTNNAMLHCLDKIAALFFKTLLNNCSFDMALTELRLCFRKAVHDQVHKDYWLFCQKLIDQHIISVM